jgi:G3E family GTPase
MVKRQLPESVYRCKGIIHTIEDPTQRYSLQVVGHRTQIAPIGEWQGKHASTEIVAIDQDMDEQQLNNLFDSCKT